MKAGDLIMLRDYCYALILEVELLHPGHPQSPPRNLRVLWLDEEKKPNWAFGPNRSTIDAFSVVKVVSRASR